MGLTTIDLRVFRTIAGKNCSEGLVRCQDKATVRGCHGIVSIQQKEEAEIIQELTTCFGLHTPEGRLRKVGAAGDGASNLTAALEKSPSLARTVY